MEAHLRSNDASTRWLDVGEKVLRRARRFSELEVDPLRERREGFVLWEELERVHDPSSRYSELQNPTTDWIYYPLIASLLQDRNASWACLGQFVGTGTGANRDWLYFFSKEISSSFGRLLEAISFFSLNAALARDKTAMHYLLTTELLETLAKRSSDAQDSGLPLVLDLAGPTAPVRGEGSFHYLDARNIGPHMESRTRRRGIRTSLVREWLKLQLRRSASEDRHEIAAPVPYLHPTAAAEFEALTSSARTYLKILTSSASEAHTAPRNGDAGLKRHWADLFAADKPSCKRLRAYIGWILDIDPGARTILTIPAWAPGKGETSYSAAIIVCFRRHISDTVVRQILQTFTLGATPVALERGQIRGALAERAAFAHQAFATFTALLGRVRRLSRSTRQDLGAVFTAQLQILQVLADAYRRDPGQQLTRDDPGPFLYDWNEGDSPLLTYRDIALDLALGRARRAPSEAVRTAARTLAPGADSGRGSRSIVSEIPNTPATLDSIVRHSGFGVLAILVLSQASYHVFRGLHGGLQPPGREPLQVRVDCFGNEARREVCLRVSNPAIDEPSSAAISRDAEELPRLAASLTAISEDLEFEVEGPRFDRERNRWSVSLRARRVEDLA